MDVATTFRRLNDGWNAEPNAPDPRILVQGDEVRLSFFLNPFRFPQFSEDQRALLRFRGCHRFRLGPTNDEGWYRGQCRFSGLAPAWGEFYEITGELLLDRCPNDWTPMNDMARGKTRHFLFYFRDQTFECDAVGYTFEPLPLEGD
jgi:hypothetical protein